MILNGNQRGGAKDLALHLMKAENERVEVHELRGFMSSDLLGAFNEMHAISRATRCQQFMYSLSLNPPKGESVGISDFMRAIAKAETKLGLTGQPRAVVFHEKNGRRHCHVVWSRIDITRMKALQLSHDREKLTALSRELFLEHGWNMPRGLEVRGERNSTNYSHPEHQQAQRVGKNAGQMKADIQAVWAQSDSRAAFEAALAELGYVLAKGDRRDFVLVDRHGEVYSLPRFAGVKTKEVRARLGDGADLPTIAQVMAQWVPERPLSKPAQELTPTEALTRITRHHAAFTPSMMERTLKSVISQDVTRGQLIDKILHSDSVIKIGTYNGKDVYSTLVMIDLEKGMAETAQDMTRHSSHKMDDHAIERAILNLNNTLRHQTHGKASLSAEQKHAIRHMVSNKQLSLVVGVAGAGKTTIMAGAKEALEAQGYRVRGAAPSGVAAAALKESGINASTLHSLEARMQLAQQMMDDNAGKPLTQKQRDFIQSAMLTNKDVLIVDEAGMVSAKQLSRIMELTRTTGAKLVLVGDPAQLQSIEAGAAFRNLLERNPHARLDEVRRQNTDWQRMATRNLSKGDVAGALQAYDAHGCIQRADTRSDAKAQLVADLIQAIDDKPQQTHLVLAYTRADVADLNTMIKAEMVKCGHVSDSNTDIAVTVKDTDGERMEMQGFAVGDRICFRENNHSIGVKNGSFGTLQSIENAQFSVQLDNGKAITFSPHDYNRFQLGYAATVHQSQGMTVDRTFVLVTPHFDCHTTYVAMSRHKEQVTLYASESDFKTPARLYHSLSKAGDKLSTLDFTDVRSKEASNPEHLHAKSQQDVQSLRHAFMRKVQQQETQHAQRQESDRRPDRGYTLDR
jgi:ATP-dependent exoDNAse (exonuclease V) alpha subunit